MNEVSSAPRPVPFVISRLLYPVYFFGAIGIALLAIRSHWSYGIASGAIIGGTALTLILLEAIYPARHEWRMTFRSFLRDLKYIASGLTSAALGGYLGTLIALQVVGHGFHWVADLPLYFAVPLAILVFDFAQYWVHRWMHSDTWPLGNLMWRIHVGHHLPDRLYVLMHPAGHPLNEFLVRQLLNVGMIWLIGFNKETVLIFTLITGVGGLFSHFNLDVRAGFLNYFFVSTELHRYHHSADPAEAKNFGIITPLWDIVFGTFVYRPGVLPERIGVDNPALYPRSEQYWRVFMLPFLSRDNSAIDGEMGDRARSAA